ncbi:hypothetical protein tb265_45730 [Gemmatimonadetes bacterium T265]|nr:hypothetical protein tb265_45730 [Gemmatimonadetes bacterium T265]
MRAAERSVVRRTAGAAADRAGAAVGRRRVGVTRSYGGHAAAHNGPRTGGTLRVTGRTTTARRPPGRPA